MRPEGGRESSRPAVCRISTVTSFLTLFGLVCLAIVVKNNIPTVEPRRHPRDINNTQQHLPEALALVDLDETSTATMIPAVPAMKTFSWAERDTREDDIRNLTGQVMLSYMNKSVNPCEDFYSYACQNWELYHPIPDDADQVDTFEVMKTELGTALAQLLESPEEEEDGEAIVKSKKLYKACMNTTVIESRQELPLLTLLSVLGGWPMIDESWNESNFSYMHLAAQLRLFNNELLFVLWVGPDAKDSGQNILLLDQTGAGLPSRDFYLTPMHKGVVDAYKQFMREVAYLLGGNETVVDDDVEAVLRFETEIARILRPLEERRNITSLYQKFTIQKLIEEYPGIDLTTYFSLLLPGNSSFSNLTVVVYARDYLVQLEEILQATSNRTISNYLLWRFIRNRIASLDDRFQRVQLDFTQALYGRKASPPRWKSCVNYVNAFMGTAVGALFVKKYFPEDSKNDSISLIEELQHQFQIVISESDWLDDGTKEEAKKKLSTMTRQVGYPDYILNNTRLAEDYQTINITEDEHFENILTFLQASFSADLSRLNQPVDKNQWGTVPAIVNAYYSRQKNQIMLPAGILQPPFYHKTLPKALNYGGIGNVIGHEIIHGFDDKGRQYDSEGNLRMWWGEASLRHFQKKAQCLIEQYGNFTIEEIQQNLNGVNTQGENIADNGGIGVAFKAYEYWLNHHPEEVSTEVLPELEDLSPRQLFFLNFAQIWCGAMRPEAALSKLKSALHSPGRFRVLGSLSNSEAFSEAYGCTPCDKMNPHKKCTVW